MAKVQKIPKAQELRQESTQRLRELFDEAGRKLFDRKFRLASDQLLKQICREDGMSVIRAQWVFLGVHWFAARASRHESIKPTLQAGGRIRHPTINGGQPPWESK